MSDYFTAYGERIRRNDATLRLLAIELKTRGCRVRAAKGEIIKFLVINKGGRQCTFGFEDIPYRWTVHVNVDYRKGKGSSREVGCRNGGENTWVAPELMRLMEEEVPQIGMGNYLKEL